MTDNEIVKALECYRGQVLFAFNGKKPEIFINDIIDLIKRQQAEIERLTETLNATIAGQETLQRYIAVARDEAVKDFSAILVSKAKSAKERFLLEPLVESVMREMGCDNESKT